MTDTASFILMTMVITGIISCCIWLSLVIRSWVVEGKPRRKRSAERRNDWIDGHAMILSMRRTGNYENAMPELKLRLYVESVCGKCFSAEICSVLSFSEILRIREGGRVPVRFNRNNYGEIGIARSRNTGSITIHAGKSAFRYAKTAIH